MSNVTYRRLLPLAAAAFVACLASSGTAEAATKLPYWEFHQYCAYEAGGRCYVRLTKAEIVIREAAIAAKAAASSATKSNQPAPAAMPAAHRGRR